VLQCDAVCCSVLQCVAVCPRISCIRRGYVTRDIAPIFESYVRILVIRRGSARVEVSPQLACGLQCVLQCMLM